MLLATAFLLLAIFGDLIVTIQITIKQGTLDGGPARKSRNGTEFHSFFAIPFAKPPVDQLRFAPPEEPNSWEGVRDARLPPSKCIQSGAFALDPTKRDMVTGEEDCLYLNVHTSNITPSSLLPVVVYIHGGFFQRGDASFYDPQYFMDHPIVFVGIQFRLGKFGFLSAVDEILPGNNGVKDQVAALKWIQKNIQAFGGDPKRVTIAGSSTGGMMVHFHMYSPLSTGLFHRAVSLGGTVFSIRGLVPPETAKKQTKSVGSYFGCPDAGTRGLVDCLRKIPAKELALLHDKFFVWEIFPTCPFAIVVEPKNVQGAFLTEYPWNQNPVNRVPWITGFCANEGCYKVARLLRSSVLLNQLSENYERLFPVIFSYEYWLHPQNIPAITASLRKFYYDEKKMKIDPINISALIELFTDSESSAGAQEAIERSRNILPAYFYLYDHRNTHSYSEVSGNTTRNLGVCHADELISLFHLMGRFPPILEGPDLAVSEKLVTYLVDFAYSGDPNGNADEKIWLPVQSSIPEYLHIQTELDTMEYNISRRNYIFWRRNLFSMLNEAHSSRIKTEL